MQIIKTGTFIVPKEIITAQLLRNYTYQQKGTDEFISTIFRKDGEYHLPRNVSKLEKLLGVTFKESMVSPSTFKIIDKTISKQIPERECKITLRDYQQEIVEKLFTNFSNGYTDNIIELATGGGKTYMLAYIIPTLKEKTLIVVDKTLLVEQMVSELSSNTNLKIKVLDDKMGLNADVVITTFQFLRQGDYRRLPKIQNEFGLLVVDEVHIAGARSINTVVQAINSKYRIGLSATPTRSDNLDEVLSDLFEHKIVGKITQQVDMEFILLENWRMWLLKIYNLTPKIPNTLF